MFRHTDHLQFDAEPEQPDPVYAHKLQELIGGAFGEMTVTMQYLFQGWNCRMPGKYKDLIMDVATEEIGHVEMIATMVARLLEGAPATAAGGGALPADSNGYPWNGRYIIASGNLLADFRANAAAEAQGRLQTARLYNMTDDPGVKAMLQFNLARDTVHQKQWLAAIEELEAAGLEGPIAPTALFDEQDQVHNKTICHLSDGPDGAKGTAWTTELEYLMDPEPLGGPGTAPKPDPALYGTYAAEEAPGLEPAEGDVETFYDGSTWKNKVVGNARASGSAETKSD